MSPPRALPLIYCTVTEMLTVSETLPPAAVTETEYVPVGVPGSVAPPSPPPLPPPPHPPSAAATKAPISRTPTNHPQPTLLHCESQEEKGCKQGCSAGQGKSGSLRKATTVCGPVVETVNVVLPLVTMEDGFAEHVASLIVGGTMQLKVTVPVNPPLGFTATDDVPDCPGVGMLTLAGFTDKLKPGMTVTVVGIEAEAAYFASPLYFAVIDAVEEKLVARAACSKANPLVEPKPALPVYVTVSEDHIGKSSIESQRSRANPESRDLNSSCRAPPGKVESSLARCPRAVFAGIVPFGKAGAFRIRRQSRYGARRFRLRKCTKSGPSPWSSPAARHGEWRTAVLMLPSRLGLPSC